MSAPTVGILHRVGDEQDHHKVERGQLPQLAASAEPEPDQDSGVDDERSPDDLDQFHDPAT